MPHTEHNENPSADTGLRGIQLLDKIIEIIERQPENWNQGWWAIAARPAGTEDYHTTYRYLDDTDYTPESCGTAFCVAGWAAHLTGYKIRWYTARDEDGNPNIEAEYCDKDGEVMTIPHAAKLVLGIHDSYLFSGFNTIDDIKRIRDELVRDEEIATH